MTTSTPTIYTPRTRPQLAKLVRSEIEKLGPQADLNHIDTSNIVNMSELFFQSEFFGNISRWNTSKVEYMDGMFQESVFNGDISCWDVSNVRRMDAMFFHGQFNGDLSLWKVGSVRTMDSMFAGSKFSGDLSTWQSEYLLHAEGMFVDTNFLGDLGQLPHSPEMLRKMFVVDLHVFREQQMQQFQEYLDHRSTVEKLTTIASNLHQQQQTQQDKVERRHTFAL